MADATKPKRRSVIRHLCPVHLVGMRGSDDQTGGTYWCRQHCLIFWHADSEYFKFVSKPQTSLKMRQRVLCPQPGHGYMFLSRVRRKYVFWGPRMGFWECSVDGCSKREERPLEPADAWDNLYDFRDHNSTIESSTKARLSS